MQLQGRGCLIETCCHTVVAVVKRGPFMQYTWFLCIFQKINSYQDLKTEIALLRITVPLSMFCLDCNALNQDLCARAEKLKQKLITFEIDENRDLNKK